MPTEPDRTEHFDRWADSYDKAVSSPRGFPFEGYDEVMDELVRQAAPEPGHLVLDLGAGTGNLAGRFATAGCGTFAVDSSPRMVERGRAKHPGVMFHVQDLRDALPAAFPGRFDRIVSAYALHHLELPGKVEMIRDLTTRRLRLGGLLLIADVSFRTAAERESARLEHSSSWDPTESYWAADELELALTGLPVRISYCQVSPLAGVHSFSAGE